MFSAQFTQKLVHFDDNSMQGLLFNAANSISKLIRKPSDLYKECMNTIEAVRKQDAAFDEKHEQEKRAEPYFLMFKLACDVNKAKVRSIALDTMHHLMTYGYFDGCVPADLAVYPVNSSGTSSNNGTPKNESSGRQQRTRLLLDVLVESLYECSMFDDEKVQLGVLQCLLIALTNPNSQVHEHSLLLSLRSCYHIYLMAASQVTKDTAKGTLMQLTQLTFSKAELSLSNVCLFPKFGSDNTIIESNIDVRIAAPTEVNVPPAVVHEDSPPIASQAEGEADEEEPSYNHNDATEVNNAVYTDEVAVDARSTQQEVLHQIDAYQILRALCKLAAKQLADPPEPASIRSKALTLELLLSILQAPGQLLTKVAPFVLMVRSDLLPALLTCLSAPSEDVCQMASSIFVAIVRHYRKYIKLELGIYITRVVCELPLHSNSTFHHKAAALDILVTLARDPTMLLEIFLNYDVEGVNVLKLMITTLERCSRATFVSDGWLNQHEENQLKVHGLEGLVSVLRSLVSWSSDVLLGKSMPLGLSVIGEEKVAEFDVEDETVLRGIANMANSHQLDKNTMALIDRLHPIVKELDGVWSLVECVENTSELCNRGKIDWTETMKRRSEVHALLQRQEDLFSAVLRFNTDFKSGIKAIFNHNLLPREPKAVAMWLQSYQNLDKVMVGELLGNHDKFYKDVLTEYMGMINFRDMHFDDAIRKLMYLFRLPGEAQMIDRILSAFAEKYYADNQEHKYFNSASTVYVLSFSVMMLNTDAHNNQVARKMSKEDFLRNNRGIDEGQDINPAFLSELYDRIVGNEIKMRDQERKLAAQLPSRKRLAVFVKEGYALAESAQELVEVRLQFLLSTGERTGADAAQEKAAMLSKYKVNRRDILRTCLSCPATEWFRVQREDVDVVSSLFSQVWPSVCATFSLLIEGDNSHRVTTLCLDGYRYTVRLACLFDLHVARQALLNSLTRFTLLNTNQTMQRKNVDAIRVLLRLVHTEGHWLDSSWFEVLTCVSEFDRMHLIARAGTSPTDLLTAGANPELSQQAVGAIPIALVDRVFTQTSTLKDPSFVAFISSLIKVSETELFSSTPRLYLLQRLLEVLCYNMNRSKEVWKSVWLYLADYFKKVGAHPVASVSLYAIDVLRQLVNTFLQDNDRANFYLQGIMLHPFTTLMALPNQTDNTEFIVQCLDKFVQVRSTVLLVGWRDIFHALGTAPLTESVVAYAFECMDKIVIHHFNAVTQAPFNALDACIQAFSAFTAVDNEEISIRAVDHLGRLAQYLAAINKTIRVRAKLPVPHALVELDTLYDGAAVVDAFLPDTSHASFFEQENYDQTPITDDAPEALALRMVTKHWFRIFNAIIQSVTDNRPNIRTHALRTITCALELLGGVFTSKEWNTLYATVVIPLFDSVFSNSVVTEDGYDTGSFLNLRPTRNPPQHVEPRWVKATLLPLLKLFITITEKHFSTMGACLGSLTSLVCRCIINQNEDTAKASVKALEFLWKELGKHFEVDHWTIFLRCVNSLFYSTMPIDLVSARTRGLVGVPLPRAVDQSEIDPIAHSLAILTKDGVEYNSFTSLVSLITKPSLANNMREAELRSEQPEPEPEVIAEHLVDEEEVEDNHNNEDEHIEKNDDSIVPEIDASVEERNDDTAVTAPAASVMSQPTTPKLDKRSNSISSPITSPTVVISPVVSPAVVTSPVAAARPLEFVTARVIVKCKVQLWLIDTISEIFTHYYADFAETGKSNCKITDAHLFLALYTLLSSADVALRFNQDRTLRVALYNAGFLKDRQSFPPELFFHENHALKTMFALLFKRLSLTTLPEHKRIVVESFDALPSIALQDMGSVELVHQLTGTAEKQFKMTEMDAIRQYALRTVDHCIKKYSYACRNKVDEVRKCMDIVLITLLEGITNLPADQLTFLFAEFYQDIVRLIDQASTSVRTAITNVLVSPVISGIVIAGLQNRK